MKKIFKHLVLRERKIFTTKKGKKIYKSIVGRVKLYEAEVWDICKISKTKLLSTEMNFW